MKATPPEERGCLASAAEVVLLEQELFSFAELEALTNKGILKHKYLEYFV